MYFTIIIKHKSLISIIKIIVVFIKGDACIIYIYIYILFNTIVFVYIDIFLNKIL